MKLVVIDSDYTFNKLDEPVVLLFGKIVGGEDEGKDVVIHVIGFEPYIIVGDCKIDIFELKNKVETIGKGYLKRVEIIKRFLPIGYQIEKSNMLRLVLFSPRVVESLRDLLKERIPEITDSNLFEADIPFKNRYLVDSDTNGMDVIEFDEKGKALENHGFNCSNLYVCKMEDIRVLKNEVVIFDY